MGALRGRPIYIGVAYHRAEVNDHRDKVERGRKGWRKFSGTVRVGRHQVEWTQQKVRTRRVGLVWLGGMTGAYKEVDMRRWVHGRVAPL